jgi:UDP-perosamine 4-acetyltransferase
MKPVILLGAGGHAAVLLEALRLCGREVLGLLTPDAAVWGGSVLGAPVLGGDERLRGLNPAEVEVAIALGATRDTLARRRVAVMARALGFQAARIVHPAAVVSPSARLGEGAQVLAGAVAQARCLVGDHCVLNTRAVAEHDCRLDAICHLGPGAVLCGGVHVGEGAHVGCGAVVIQGVRIGAGTTIGAGSLVLRDVPAGVMAYGSPARVVCSLE